MAVRDAIEQTEEGAVVPSTGWFVLNLGDAAWTHDELQDVSARLA